MLIYPIFYVEKLILILRIQWYAYVQNNFPPFEPGKIFRSVTACVVKILLLPMRWLKLKQN